MTSTDTSPDIAVPRRPDANRRPVSSTRRMLAAGAVAGPLFAVTCWLQVATVSGFDITQHALSQLSLGPNGWIQIINFITCGVLFVLGAVGLHRTLDRTRITKWTARLVGGFGVSLIIGGVLPTDPAHGYPTGSPTESETTWHGVLHAIAPSVGIVLAAIACLLFARLFATEHRHGPAIASLVVGLLMFSPDAYPGPTGAGYTLALAVTGSLGFIWCSAVIADRLRGNN